MNNLRLKDAGKNAVAFENLVKGKMDFAEIDVLDGLINAEFLMEGILPTLEPNGYGLELDLINRPRLRS